MKQAIAGVAPTELAEVTVMQVWPCISMFALGRFHGRLYALQAGPYIFTLGNLFCLLTIPGALALYFLRLAPGIGKRYTLTNRRIIEHRAAIQSGPLRFNYAAESKSVELDRFETIDIEVLPGQKWYDAGNLVFRQGNIETFRLDDVSRPQAFRHTCLKARDAYVGIKEALQREAVA